MTLITANALFITADALGVQLCAALGLKADEVARIIIDIDCRTAGPIPVYVKMYASERVLEIDWEAVLEGASVFKVLLEEAPEEGAHKENLR